MAVVVTDSQLQRGVRRGSCTHSANGTGSTRRQDGRRMRTCLEPGRAPCTRGAHQQRAPATRTSISIVARFRLEQRQNDPSTADGRSCAPSPCSCQHRAPARHPTLADSPEAARHQLLAASPLLAVAAAHCRRCIGRLELPSCDMHSPAPQSHVAPPAMLWHGLRFLSRYEPQQPKRAMFCSSAGCAETSTELVTHCTHFVILTHMP